MNPRPQSPPIPAEALARVEGVRAALEAMAAAAPSLEPPSLQALRAIGGGGPCLDPDGLVAQLLAAECVEEAAEMLRAARRGSGATGPCAALAARLAPLANKAHQRRTAGWHMDSRRTLIRLQCAKVEAALAFDDGDLRGLLLSAFRLEGLPLALDLGKRPKPILTVGLPLPAGVGGLEEYVDVVLKVEPRETPEGLMARLNQRLPAGLRIHRWQPLPNHAAPVAELALLSHWRWVRPVALRVQAAERVAAFQAAEAWPWDRGGTKAEAPLDLRAIVQDLRWEADALCFSTRMGAFSALNPAKVLGAILALEPAAIQGLLRCGVALKPDARLDQAERFEPKLKNMYEDAVLLSGGANIVLVEEDDDEPLRLG